MKKSLIIITSLVLLLTGCKQNKPKEVNNQKGDEIVKNDDTTSTNDKTNNKDNDNEHKKESNSTETDKKISQNKNDSSPKKENSKQTQTSTSSSKKEPTSNISNSQSTKQDSNSKQQTTNSSNSKKENTSNTSKNTEQSTTKSEPALTDSYYISNLCGKVIFADNGIIYASRNYDDIVKYFREHGHFEGNDFGLDNYDCGGFASDNLIDGTEVWYIYVE